MTEFDRNTTVRELDRIADLYDEKNKLLYQLNSIKDEEEAEIDDRKQEMFDELEEFQDNASKEFDTKVPTIPAICNTTPPPSKLYNGKGVWSGALSGLICLICLCFSIFSIISNYFSIFSIISEKLMNVCALLLIPILGFGIYWLASVMSVEDYLNYKKKITEWAKDFESYSGAGAQERFLNECVEYEKRFLEVVDICTQQYNKEQKRFKKIVNEVHTAYSSRLDATQKELDDVTAQLDAVTLIHPDLFDIAARISKLLKTQRADSLKEAINFAIEEKRKEAQEKARRQEARRQEAILKEQAYQTRMHEQAMEITAEREAAAARKHAYEMEALATAQAEQAKKQADETRIIREEIQKQNRKKY